MTWHPSLVYYLPTQGRAHAHIPKRWLCLDTRSFENFWAIRFLSCRWLVDLSSWPICVAFWQIGARASVLLLVAKQNVLTLFFKRLRRYETQHLIGFDKLVSILRFVLGRFWHEHEFDTSFSRYAYFEEDTPQKPNIWAISVRVQQMHGHSRWVSYLWAFVNTLFTILRHWSADRLACIFWVCVSIFVGRLLLSVWVLLFYFGRSYSDTVSRWACPLVNFSSNRALELIPSFCACSRCVVSDTFSDA